MEHMVEGSVARLFRSPVQPAEIAKRLERAMEAHQQVSVRRVIVPNVYRAFLHPQDMAAFQPIRAEVEQEMANYLTCLLYTSNMQRKALFCTCFETKIKKTGQVTQPAFQKEL